jgi:hypothetical protein
LSTVSDHQNRGVFAPQLLEPRGLRLLAPAAQELT